MNSLTGICAKIKKKRQTIASTEIDFSFPVLQGNNTFQILIEKRGKAIQLSIRLQK